jgi:hypothetical protein
MPDNHEDRGIYIVEGSISVAGQDFDAGRMMVFRPGDRIAVAAGDRGARLMILGGATFPGPRYIWWNFVASSFRSMTATNISRCRIDRLWRDMCRSRSRMTASRTGAIPNGEQPQ